LGHCNQDDARKIVKHIGPEVLGFSIKPGQKQACEECSKAKARQKNVNKEVKSETSDGRIYLDISSIRPPKNNKEIKVNYKTNWEIVVREESGLAWSSFHAKKDHMVEPTCEKISQWKKNGMKITELRMDGASENKELAKRLHSADWQMNYITIEVTATNTPQQNSRYMYMYRPSTVCEHVDLAHVSNKNETKPTVCAVQSCAPLV